MIITTQRDLGNKNRIGYSLKERHVNSKSYADSLLSTFKKKNEEKISNDQNSRRLIPPIRKEDNTIPKKFYQSYRKKAINCRAYRKKNLKVKNYILKDKQDAN
jgi:hypothetical protein